MDKPKLALALAVARGNEQQLVSCFALLTDRHDREADIRDNSTLLARWSNEHIALLEPAIKKYGKTVSERPERIRSALFVGTRVGGLGVLMDIKDMALLVQEQELTWTAINEAAQELHDQELIDVASKCKEETSKQLAWLKTRFKETAAQALTVMADPGAEMRASVPKHLSFVALPDPVWGPLAVALMTLAVGVPAVLAGFQPWLIPSLGPTAFLQVAMPAQPSSRLYNVVVGHVGGLIAGFVGVWLFNAWNDPVVLQDHQLTVGRLGAATVAMALSMGLGILMRASHPPAAATVLIVALGSMKDQNAVIAFLIGLAIVAVVGEVVRRVRLGQPSWGRAKVEQRTASG
jgi:hypothetical protein